MGDREEVTIPPLPPWIKAGTVFSDPGGMRGWVDLVCWSPIRPRLSITSLMQQTKLSLRQTANCYVMSLVDDDVITLTASSGKRIRVCLSVFLSVPFESPKSSTQRGIWQSKVGTIRVDVMGETVPTSLHTGRSPHVIFRTRNLVPTTSCCVVTANGSRRRRSSIAPWLYVCSVYANDRWADFLWRNVSQTRRDRCGSWDPRTVPVPSRPYTPLHVSRQTPTIDCLDQPSGP